jgi:hypothetical protein
MACHLESEKRDNIISMIERKLENLESAEKHLPSISNTLHKEAISYLAEHFSGVTMYLPWPKADSELECDKPPPPEGRQVS